MADLQTELVPIDDLVPYPDNPREGDVGAIAVSLSNLGQYRPVVVNRPTMTILAGNHTVEAARQLGWVNVAATFVDVDEDTAARIVLVDNRTNDLATYNEEILAELLTELANSDLGLVATGYDGEDLDTLLFDLSQSLEFEPEEEAAKLDQGGHRPTVTCPNCAHEFTWGERKR